MPWAQRSKKRNLEVKTQMSETIWLEPASERTVFLQIKNTSDKDMGGLQGKIADAVKAKGYQVVTSPDKAYYWIQANVLKADKNGSARISGMVESRL
ncbi:conjugal transfer surface exclusion protein TraT [Escherichia coli]|uniref:TraT complement resistance protein n=1 Tax=Escherichia coli TaxID=562 RepID=A0A376VVZ1_ECOLX|nr:conjugal transfer surface exclusion protein TraT [Escherichia coli]